MGRETTVGASMIRRALLLVFGLPVLQAQVAKLDDNNYKVPKWGAMYQSVIENRLKQNKNFPHWKLHFIPMRTVVLRYRGTIKTGNEALKITFESDPIDMDLRLPRIETTDLEEKYFNVRFFFIQKISGGAWSSVGTALSAMTNDHGQPHHPHNNFPREIVLWRDKQWKVEFELNLNDVLSETQKVTAREGELQEAIVDGTVLNGSDQAFRILLPIKDQIRLWDDLVNQAKMYQSSKPSNSK
jgi:hypothetical protein